MHVCTYVTLKHYLYNRKRCSFCYKPITYYTTVSFILKGNHVSSKMWKMKLCSMSLRAAKLVNKSAAAALILAFWGYWKWISQNLEVGTILYVQCCWWELHDWRIAVLTQTRFVFWDIKIRNAEDLEVGIRFNVAGSCMTGGGQQCSRNRNWFSE